MEKWKAPTLSAERQALNSTEFRDRPMNVKMIFSQFIVKLSTVRYDRSKSGMRHEFGKLCCKKPVIYVLYVAAQACTGSIALPALVKTVKQNN